MRQLMCAQLCVQRQFILTDRLFRRDTFWTHDTEENFEIQYPENISYFKTFTAQTLAHRIVNARCRLVTDWLTRELHARVTCNSASQ